MAVEKEDVLGWLSSLSYNELRHLAGEYSIKKNQKKQKLITLLAKIVKSIPEEKKAESEKSTVSQGESETVVVSETRKRKHSPDEERKVHDEVVAIALPSAQMSTTEHVEPALKRNCVKNEEEAEKPNNEDVTITSNNNDVEAAEKPADEDTLNTTFEVPDPTPHLTVPEVAVSVSQEPIRNTDVVEKAGESSWISEDSVKLDNLAVENNLTRDQSSNADLLSEDDAECDLTDMKTEEAIERNAPVDELNIVTNNGPVELEGKLIKSDSIKPEAFLETLSRIEPTNVPVAVNEAGIEDSSSRQIVTEKMDAAFGSEQSGSEKMEFESAEERSTYYEGSEGKPASADDEASDVFGSSDDQLVKGPTTSASTKRLQRGRLTARFAAQHKKLLQKGTNIEEDVQRIQDLHRKHEDEVPPLFKRLATPKRPKKSGIPVPIRSASAHYHERGYDFSHAPANPSKMSFKFGEADPGRDGDVQRAFSVSRSPARNALRSRNQSVPPKLETEIDNSDDCTDGFHLIGSCPRFLKNHATPDRKTTAPALNDGSSAASRVKVLPYVDTTSMTDAQFHMARMEGKIPSFCTTNRKSTKVDRSDSSS